MFWTDDEIKPKITGYKIGILKIFGPVIDTINDNLLSIAQHSKYQLLTDNYYMD